MTDKEVMQQALVAMGINQYTVSELAPHKAVMKFNDAITALRTALAMHQVSEFAQAQEQQAEPICPECKAAVLYECVACSSNNYPPQQQAEPVAQREWVGLTPEEILDLFDVNNVYGSKWIAFARTVEAKLKEKNSD